MYYEPEYTPDEPQNDAIYEMVDGKLVEVEVPDDAADN